MTDLEQSSVKALGVMPVAHRGGIWALIALFALLIAVTGRLAVADFHTLMAAQWLERGAGTMKLQDAQTVARTQGHLEAALKLAPDSAWALHMMTAWRLRASQMPTANALAETGAALASARAWVRERPAYPQAWSQLALLKFRLGERDEELRTALAQAERLGPWETDVLLGIMGIGLATWADLDEPLRQRLGGAMVRATRRNPERAAFIATALGRTEVFCGLKDVKMLNIKACAVGAKKK